MSIDEFWQIIDEVHISSDGDMEEKCRLLEEKLSGVSLDELQSFAVHFADLLFAAYRYELWDAADIINRGCGDDSFHDFRCTLISMGRRIYEAGISDADSLAGYEVLPGISVFEGYDYVCGKVYNKVHQDKGPPSQQEHRKHPKKPSGIETHPWERSIHFPKLAAKFGHHDSDYENQKIRHEKEVLQSGRIERFRDILLGAHLISPGGWIPPLKVAQEVLCSGRSRESKTRISQWEPMELTEEDYWAVVVNLERMKADELKQWSYLMAGKLQLDTGGTGSNGYEDWTNSLKARGVY